MQVTQEKLLEDIENGRNTLQTDKLDMSFGEIMSMYEKDEIIVNPEFQRLYRWTEYQKTRFIESIIIGIPIPPIFVAEDKDGRWELVDGLQRLSTILSFFGMLKTMPDKNNWILSDGDLIQSLDKFNCSHLPLKIQLNIKRASCRIEIIKWNSKYDLRFELFNRLNTGGSPLTNQEIRNSLFREVSSEFNNFLKKLGGNKDFIKIINISQEQLHELYHEELVLRFMSLYKNSKNVKKSIAQHMTDFMREASENKDFNYTIFEQVFNKTVNILSPLGAMAFRAKGHNFSTAVFDTTMIGISENIHLYGGAKVDKIQAKIDLVKRDDKYQAMTRSGGNNSVERVRKRLLFSKEIFGTL